ncbi:MAG: alpha/beta hydrolase [Jatrophihabitantaceae bacterium]
MPSTMLRRTRPLLAAVTSLLILAGCSQTIGGHGSTPPSASNPPSSGFPATPAPSGTSRSAVPAKITFSTCDTIFDSSQVPVPAGLKGKITFGCAKLAVPLNYSDPSGPSISLELIKVHDTASSNQIGSLLVNPGGPGGSGLELAVGLTGEIAPVILSHFDLIGFDPRGVGLSSPIECISDATKDKLNAASPDVRTAAGFQQAKELAQQTAEACSTKYGKALAQYNTVNTARDMDQIRQVVGDAQMNYLGFSYGTELGSIYAHLFPGKIRVAVLDGAVDPLTDGIVSNADQLQGFELAFDQFAADCLTHSPCKSLGNPRQAVYHIVAQATAHPLGTSNSSDPRTVTSSLALTGVLEALYSKSEWTALGNALITARGGDGKGLLALADEYNQRTAGRYSNIMDANTTIGCNDSKPGPTDAQITATAKSWATRFPIFGTWAVGSLFDCQQWQPDRTPIPLPTAATPTKVLVIGNVHDPATPYQGAIDLAKTMGNAELLSWDGEGHTSYLQGSSCIDAYVNTYLVSQKLPPTGVTCPS